MNVQIGRAILGDNAIVDNLNKVDWSFLIDDCPHKFCTSFTFRYVNRSASLHMKHPSVPLKTERWLSTSVSLSITGLCSPVPPVSWDLRLWTLKCST